MSKTVWITGASSGIGQEFARRYAKMGCRLILTARRRELEAAQKRITELNGIFKRLYEDSRPSWARPAASCPPTLPTKRTAPGCAPRWQGRTSTFLSTTRASASAAAIWKRMLPGKKK